MNIRYGQITPGRLKHHRVNISPPYGQTQARRDDVVVSKKYSMIFFYYFLEPRVALGHSQISNPGIHSRNSIGKIRTPTRPNTLISLTPLTGVTVVFLPHELLTSALLCSSFHVLGPRIHDLILDNRTSKQQRSCQGS